MNKEKFVNLIRLKMQDNRRSIDIEMSLIGKSCYAPDVIERSRNMDRFVQWNVALEDLLRTLGE